MALFMWIELYFSIFLGTIHNEFFSTFLSSWTVYNILCFSFVILHYTCGCYNFFPLFTSSMQFLFALFTSTIHVFFFFFFFFCKLKRLACCSFFFPFYFTVDVNINYFYIFHL
jgi:hypothetical protein